MSPVDAPGLPKLVITRTPPVNLKESDESLFAHEFRKEIAASQRETLSRVRVLSNGHLVRKFLPLPQSFAEPRTGIGQARRIVSAMVRSLHSSSTKFERGLFATDEFSNGFFHWVCDVLPRLEAVDQSVPNELKSRTLVVPAMAAFGYVLPSLAAYDLETVHLMHAHEAAFCADLLVLPPVAPTGNYRPDLMVSLRERFRRRFGPANADDKVFISRSKALRRKIANEEQLLPVLKSRKFSPLMAEGLPFEEQVRRVGAASVLVGNHGAGLAHLLWMRPGASVVELRLRGDRWNNCYFSLASALGIRYYYLLCDGVGPRGDAHQSDIVVRPDELDAVLAQACAAVAAA